MFFIFAKARGYQKLIAVLLFVENFHVAVIELHYLLEDFSEFAESNHAFILSSVLAAFVVGTSRPFFLSA